MAVEWWRGGATLAGLGARSLAARSHQSLPVTHSSAGKARGRRVGTGDDDGWELKEGERANIPAAWHGSYSYVPPRARRVSRPLDRGRRTGTGTGRACRARDLTSHMTRPRR